MYILHTDLMMLWMILFSSGGITLTFLGNYLHAVQQPVIVINTGNASYSNVSLLNRFTILQVSLYTFFSSTVTVGRN